MPLNRQVKAVLFIKEKRKITNSDYQSLNNVSRETATRDIKELTEKGLLNPSGQKGTGTADMVRIARENNLQEPVFEQNEDFKTTIYRPSTD